MFRRITFVNFYKLYSCFTFAFLRFNYNFFYVIVRLTTREYYSLMLSCRYVLLQIQLSSDMYNL